MINNVIFLTNRKDTSFYFSQRRDEVLVLCLPEGIFAVVDTAVASKCKDPYRMTIKKSL